MLKLLTPEDIPEVVQLGQNFFNSSPYASLEFSPEATTTFLQDCIDHPDQRVCVLAVEQGRTVGAIIGALISPPFSSDTLAQEIAWWVEPEYRKSSCGIRLKEAYEYWASKMGAKKISMALISSFDHSKALGRLYEKHGYYQAETAYVKDI